MVALTYPYSDLSLLSSIPIPFSAEETLRHVAMAGVDGHHHHHHGHASHDQLRGGTGTHECVMAPFAGHLRGVR